MRLHRNIRLLGWFNFLLDFRPYAPVAILYFAQVSGSFALGMSVFSITMLASSLLEVPTGIISDRVGRKRTVALGAIASALSVTCYALGTYPALIAGAIFEGTARAFFSGNNDALLHDTLSESGQTEAYQEYLGKTSSMYQLALAISAVIGSILAAVSFPLVMGLSVIPQVINVIVSLAFIEPKTHSRAETNIYAHLRTSFRNIIQNARLRDLSAASILGFAFGEATFQFRAAFIATLWPVWAIGFTRLISNFLAASSFYFAGRLINRFGAFRLLISGITFSNTLTLVMTFIPSVLSPAIMSVTSIFFGVNTVASNGLMQREFSAEQRATMGSITAFGGSLMFAVFSLVLGALADQIGATGAFAVGTALAFIPVVFYWRAFRREGVGAAIAATD
ncbi:MAG: MFS transporter [Anaerolineae bacterium]|nr:MFS transporter [Anaerolineae bacterium]